MKFVNKIRSMSKKGKLLVAALTLTAFVGLPLAVNAGFFPGRATFDYNKSDPNGDCNDPNSVGRQGGRCGSMTGPVFNSFVNTPSYGDEREFMDGRKSEQPMPYNNTDTVSDVTEGSKKVVLRMYVHNNANETTNASGLGIARNAKAKMELPTEAGSALQAVGAISADNAVPAEVTDTVYLTANRKFKVQYEPGTAKLMRDNIAYPLSDSIVTTGAPIGDKVMDGNLPGCFDYAALVEITVNIIPEDDHELQVLKEVKKTGDPNWQKEVYATPGEEVQWLLSTKNIGLDAQNNVTLRDIMPPHMEMVPGSVEMINADGSTYPQQDQPLFGNGLNLGNYPSGGGRYVKFKAKALGDFDGCYIRLQNVAKVRSDQKPTEQEDDADVVVVKEDCEPPVDVLPSYSCDLLQGVYGENKSVKFTTTASAKDGAVIKGYVYDFGDGETLTTDKAEVEHTYKADGQYAARVKVMVEVDGETVFAEGAACATSVTFTSTPPTPGTPVTPGKPGTPGTLPATGAGSVIAIFSAVVSVSSAAYYMVARRAARI